MKEYVFTELGYFSKEVCEKIKKAMDGKTYMNFKVEYSNCETDSGYIEIFN